MLKQQKRVLKYVRSDCIDQLICINNSMQVYFWSRFLQFLFFLLLLANGIILKRIRIILIFNSLCFFSQFNVEQITPRCTSIKGILQMSLDSRNLSAL